MTFLTDLFGVEIGVPTVVVALFELLFEAGLFELLFGEDSGGGGAGAALEGSPLPPLPFFTGVATVKQKN